MLAVGLSGGIGSGKSTVAAELARLGAVVVDADALAREVVAPGTAGLAAVVEAFGPGVLRPDGGLDRPALGRLVFADDAARRRLEGITHPLVAAEAARRQAAAGPGAVVVHDVPLLVENGLAQRYDLVVVVGAPVEVRLARLRGRGMTEEDARARIRAQADDAARRAVADVWLDNSGTRAELVEQVRRLWAERLLPAAGERAGARRAGG
ncbi:dephospho-CoA kinase [Georgenia sp. TF02-10]|uniref:dephospho-CoA kinase n=1 Tax=Georgenia sp. TF02-10 TaxID=2917725 RepID=UPI001FA7FBDF|nr:dephospho-CoA kinase [Georgenia sp. TF02-10]UNX56173.1 dephospho-CoA kinase [Georgenia sp. TF02-10]